MGCEIANLCASTQKTANFEKKSYFVNDKSEDFQKTFDKVKTTTNNNNNNNNNNNKTKKVEKENVKAIKKDEHEHKENKVNKKEVKNESEPRKVDDEKKLDTEKKLDDEKSEYLDELKELLESIGIEVSDEMLSQMKIDLIDINKISEMMNLESFKDADIDELINSLKDVSELLKNLKGEILNNSSKSKNIKIKFEELLKNLSGEIKEIETSKSDEQIKDNLKNMMLLLGNKKINSNENSEMTNQLESTKVENVILEENKKNIKENEINIDLSEKAIEDSPKIEKSSNNKESVLKNNDSNLTKEFNNLDLSREKNNVKENFKTELDFKLLSKVKQMNKVYSQIKDNFTTKVDGKVSEMKVLLNPKSLGEVEMKMTIEKGHVIAEFKVENAMVKQTIESNLQDLKNSLSEKGYSLESLDVSVGDDRQDESQQNKQFYENIFNNDESDELEDSISLIEESRMLNVMKRRSISYLG